jgi:hypothetical protein
VHGGNDVFDKGFFRIETFQDLAHLKRGACAFERFHNSHHRYSVLKGVTPDEYEKRLGFEARLLAWRRAPDLAASPRLARVRQAHPIQPRVEDPRIQDLDATGVRASLRHCGPSRQDAALGRGMRGTSVARRASVLPETVTTTGTMWC